MLSGKPQMSSTPVHILPRSISTLAGDKAFKQKSLKRLFHHGVSSALLGNALWVALLLHPAKPPALVCAQGHQASFPA